MEQPVISDQPLRTGRGWLWLLAALALGFVVHAPSLGLGFVGDDFEWWLAARTALEEPRRLVLPFGGFRPANLWTIVLDQALYGIEPTGYHLTSILFHLAGGAGLWLALRRFAFAAPAAAAVAALWMCSPYSLKPVVSLCERFEPMLLIVWLGMLVLWPRPGEAWRIGRLAAIIALAAFSALVKESWVVLPGFVLCFELVLRRVAWVRALRSAALAAAGVAVYVAAYVLDPPIAGSYYATTLAPAAKLPHSWAVFLGLTRLDPSSTQLGLAEAAATITLVALAWWGWRRRCAATAVGLSLFLLPLLPVLTVPFLVTRYTYLPLAGFLVVSAAAVRAAVEALPHARRPLASTLVVVAAAAYFGHGLWLVRGDQADAGRRDDAHRRLLAEATAFAPQLPRDGLVLGVRLERESANRALLDRVEGVPKAYYERARFPYGLVRWAPLFSYVLDPGGGPLYEECTVGEAGVWSVVGHRSGGFAVLASEAGSAPLEAARWLERGAFVEGFRPLGARD
ncbi:MAG: hypothetical protein C3F15_05845 [Holophagae bacterium]|nr:MAG: hypothetical protein C3F15_05845 [Holophagae bacterium]